MAKLTNISPGNINPFQGGKTPNTGQGLPVFSTPPPAIAYEVSSAGMLIALTPDSTYADKDFTGLRIEFRDTDGLINFPKVFQVYFDPQADTNQPESYFLKKETNLKLATSLAKKIEIHNDSDGEWSSIAGPYIPPSPDGEDYRLLDYFDESIDFVYFPAGQVRFLCESFDNLIISGSQISMGRKLHHPDYAMGMKKHPENCFTLKIEGQGLKEHVSVEQGSGDAEDSKGADTALGHPCPPKWQQFMSVLEPVLLRHPGLAAQVRQIWNGWQKFTMHHVSTMDPNSHA
jgi:hypothetical protein